MSYKIRILNQPSIGRQSTNAATRYLRGNFIIEASCVDIQGNILYDPHRQYLAIYACLLDVNGNIYQDQTILDGVKIVGYGNGKDANSSSCIFTFNSIGIKRSGSYRVRFSLVRILPAQHGVTLSSIDSGIINVYSSRKYNAIASQRST
ncbi:uncharacterized protein ASCRUDRAFT_130944 [Ascoidea rubescens DSM 1968]|uniref:Velvet domain-containing protein n=1 Tax=Ascoidea rubescens DSM 1968 TaxID=1344418 RepID=A0A1D2V8Y3_9ASCO|nr:hypothetical protein ASCRUDRAFT_130944 [Ascoidea rubescens DSM 1968]ODV57965.1 hypothetical protein ASCRUDRAFT_130944 [Ascoidea rubescens DSM 1968]